MQSNKKTNQNAPLLIFLHYLRRSLLEPIGLLILTVMPVALIVILTLVNEANLEGEYMVNGYNMASTGIALPMFVMFQFFGGSIILDWLYNDFKSPRRWRILASPIKSGTFFLCACIASWIFSVIQGALILVVSVIFLDVYVGNIFVLILTFFAVSVMGQLLFLLLFVLTKKKSSAEGCAQLVIQSMAVFIWIGAFGEENGLALVTFLSEKGTPIALARRAMLYSGFVGDDMGVALGALGILFLITILMGALLVFLIRRKRYDSI